MGSPAMMAPDEPEGIGTIASAPRMGALICDELAVKPVMSCTCAGFVKSFFFPLPPFSFFVSGASRNSDA